MVQKSRYSTNDRLPISLQGTAQRLPSWITPRRLAYLLAAACLALSAAAVVHAALPGSDKPTSHSSSTPASTSTHQHTKTTLHAEGSSTSSSFSSTTTETGTSTSLNVNGQNIDVPTNGETQRTIVGPDGNQTIVNTSGHSSSDGTSTNVHVDVHSSSNSTGDPVQ